MTEAPTAPSQLGKRSVRGYRLLELVGEGSFGEVYRAIQPQVEREVAIKSIHAELANHPDFVRRFEREAQLVARLEHPHIVPLYDYWREPDAAYLVMRYLRGGSLSDLLEGGPLSLEHVANLLDQIGAALAAAHRQGVVHRDVKPGNVLLDEDGNAYLSDFGIAVDTGAPDQTTGTMIRGTPAYLSPEQIRLEQVTPRSDIYALGIVLYEMVTGEHPFPGTSLTDLLEQHLHQPVPSVRAIRGDAPAGIDDAIATAAAKDPRARFTDVLELCAAFRAEVEGTRARIVPAREPRNPYKGLRAFLEADSADFFGREVLTGRILERLAEPGVPGFLCLVGPSGSGKSSVVRAGVVPAIRQGAIPGSERWFVVELLPGAHPMRELETALLGISVTPPPSLLEELERDEHGLARAVDRLLPDPDAELLIVLDQLEELFAMAVDDAERALVLESLRAVTSDPSSRVRVVATLRADLFDRPLSVRGFGDLLAARTEIITPMSPEALERAIVGPAERVGLDVEPGMVATMVADVVDRPGALPLLQYALTEIADREGATSLTLDAYRHIGGVSGALSRRAEQLFAALDPTGRDAVRQVFLQLVSLDEGGGISQRRVRRSELAFGAEGVDAVFDGFGRYRLISFDRDSVSREATVEIAHEALIDGWTRLRGWIDEARDDIATQRRLSRAVAEWEASDQDPSYLLRGTRLAQAEEWAATTSLVIRPEDRAYLGSSIRERDRERDEEASRLAKERAVERRSVRRLRGLVAALTAGVVVAATLTAIAFGQRARADRASRLAAARELAGAAAGAVASDPDLATLLALESIRTTAEDGVVVADAEDALRRAMPVLTVHSLGGYREMSFTPDLGRMVIVGDTGPTAVWDLTAGQPGRRTFTVPSDTPDSSVCPGVAAFERWKATGAAGPPPTCGAVFEAALSPDGTLLATGHGDASVRVWDVEHGRALTTIDLYAGFPDERYAEIVTRRQGGASPPAHLLMLLGYPGALAPNVGFSSDGDLVWTEGVFGGWRLWEVSTGAQVLEAPSSLGLGQNERGNQSFSGDGRWLALGGVGIEIFDLASREAIARYPILSWAPPVGPPAPAFAPDGILAAIPGADEIRLVNLGNPKETRQLSWFVGTAGAGGLVALEFSPDGERLAGATSEGLSRVWDVATGQFITLPSGLRGASVLAWSPDSRLLAVGGGREGYVRVLDVVSGRVVETIPVTSGAVVDLAFTPDGEQLAAATDDGSVSTDLLDLQDLIAFARDRVSRGLTHEECQRYLHVPSCAEG